MNIKKIIIFRTDRIGDLLLTMPAVSALKQRFPGSKITMVISSQTKDLVGSNPDVDDVIVLDGARMRGLKEIFIFAKSLRKERFDLAVVFNPSKSFNLAIFLAGIPNRLGWDRKWPFLLTNRVKDEKSKGEKHEIEYNLDLVRSIGVAPGAISIFVPETDQSRLRIKNLLQENGISDTDDLIAMHPFSTNPAKLWPMDRFAAAADILYKTKGVRVLLIGDTESVKKSRGIRHIFEHEIIDLTGKIALEDLPSLFKRSRLLISNDSGPMHIAAAVGTPVVAIFGRNLPGVGPKRWGPHGRGHIILHKDPGCKVCEDNRCPIDYRCMKDITVQDVVDASLEIMEREDQKKVIYRDTLKPVKGKRGNLSAICISEIGWRGMRRLSLDMANHGIDVGVYIKGRVEEDVIDIITRHNRIRLYAIERHLFKPVLMREFFKRRFFGGLKWIITSKKRGWIDISARALRLKALHIVEAEDGYKLINYDGAKIEPGTLWGK
ncbi:MAG: lipopolysaccharide heptosyltransferase II [Candidatus Omnitrophica bacterium]|nr:lipopolysaccharide heptosyltransferase II [Candidatus Omnitrophota bacterium]